jgi:hypothetical protein
MRFDAVSWNVLHLGPFLVFVRGRMVPVHDALDQKMRLAEPTLIVIVQHGGTKIKKT